jgi:uncharacterized small protein (DUF1192 family)
MNEEACTATTAACEEDQEAAPTQDGELGDRDLILRSLSLSLEERLAVLQDFVDTFWTMKHG